MEFFAYPTDLYAIVFVSIMTLILVKLCGTGYSPKVRKNVFRGTWKSHTEESIFGTIEIETFDLRKDAAALVTLTYDKKSTYRPGKSIEVEFEGYNEIMFNSYILRQVDFELGKQYFTLYIYAAERYASLTSIHPFDAVSIDLQSSSSEVPN